MKHAIIVEAELIDKKTLKLDEPLENIHGKVELIIKDKGKNGVKKKLIGFSKGKVHMSKDFNEPLEDFKEYIN